MMYGLYKYECGLKFTGIIGTSQKKIKEYIFNNSPHSSLETYETYWRDSAQRAYEIKQLKKI